MQKFEYRNDDRNAAFAQRRFVLDLFFVHLLLL